MRRLKVGIRPQLIILVCFSSLFSLLILAIVTGVYFSASLSNTRSERLEVISQLKTSQVKQSVDSIFYQVYFLSTKEMIYAPLVNNRAGNTSNLIFSDAQLTLDQFLQSSELFAGARLYDINLETVANSYNNVSNITEQCQDLLYPLQQNATLPNGILDIGPSGYATYFTGPASNTSDINSPYFIGLTIPVYANTSILLSTPSIAGFLSVIASASGIQSAIYDNATNANIDYEVLVVKPHYDDAGTSNKSDFTGFQAVFPTKANVYTPGVIYSLSESPMVENALLKKEGTANNVQSIDGKRYAIGFTENNIDAETYWVIIIQQARSTFMGPNNKLRNIIIGVVIGIGVFMCLITFPLAVWFIKPISKLKEATEAITMSKKAHKQAMKADKLLSMSPSSPYGRAGRGSSSVSSGRRNSLHESVVSYGIRLPGKIPSSKNIIKDEFTELCDAFNIMTEELDKQYTHLEDRVKQRTKELELSKIEAETANEAKTVFIANISHELRTPLNGILGMTSIALDERDPNKINDSLRLIHRSGELLLHILTELLTYSKNTLNRSKLEKSNFEVLEIVHQVQSIFSKLAQDQRVNLKILLKPNVIRQLILYGDSNRIIQVVMNLVSNSLKFTPVDGSVDVSFDLLGTYDMEASKATGFKEVCLVDTNGENPVTNEYYTNNVRDSFFDENKDLPPIPEANELLNNDEKHFSSSQLPQSDGSVRIGGSVASVAAASIDSANGTDSSTNKTQQPPKHRPYSHRHQFKPTVEINNKTYNLRKLARPKNWVLRIAVTDTGPGIEPALQQKVFEPFIQGDQTLSRSYGGTGLGLSICRQLATMMKGTLTLKSEIGVGSTFTFTVPLPQTYEIGVPESEMFEFCDDEFNPDSRINRKVAFADDPFNEKNENSNTNGNKQQSTQKQEHYNKQQINNHSYQQPQKNDQSHLQSKSLEVPQFEKPHLITRGSTGTAGTTNSAGYISDSGGSAKSVFSELRILVAEDNLVNQEVIRRMLKLEGFSNITLACNGQEAIDYVDRSLKDNLPFDFIFMDVQMPKVDGLLATKEIRNKLHHHGPIIALTAFADESNVKECLASGMSGFLSKPIKRVNLRKVVEDLLSGNSTSGESST